MTRRQAESMRGRVHAALVSITDAGKGPANIYAPTWQDVLHVEFNDVWAESSKNRAAGRLAANKTHAQQIAAFIRAHLNHSIYVQCETGIGRSTAVCAVLVEMGWRYLKPHELGLDSANPLVLRLLRQELLVSAAEIKNNGASGC